MHGRHIPVDTSLWAQAALDPGALAMNKRQYTRESSTSGLEPDK